VIRSAGTPPAITGEFLHGRADAVQVSVAGRGASPRLPQQGHPACELAADRPGAGDRVIQVGEQRPGARQQGFAGQRQVDALRRAAEQVAPHEALQTADLAAERGLGDEQPLCCPAETEILGDRDERAQVPQLDRVRRLRQREHIAIAVHHTTSLPHRIPAGNARAASAVCPVGISHCRR
jgi:hypothetical protein